MPSSTSNRYSGIAPAFIVTALAVWAGAQAFAAEWSTSAKQALIVEHAGRRVLFEKDASRAMAPSSMTKLMTLFLAFEALEQGRAKESEPVSITTRAARAKGATADLREGERVAFGQLIALAAVHSANDAAIAIAEHLAGSQEAFARRMSERAAELGLTGSRFVNATGHSANGHRMTARDVALLAGLLIERFPRRYAVLGDKEISFRGRTYRNRNPLLDSFPGADGLKTGQTAAGGYGIAASAVRDGRRLIIVLNGLASEAARAEETRRLLEQAFKKGAN
jgi:D-alanyl-D-alanine carboxypeptidase (penicillin-binding protein 5/6)